MWNEQSLQADAALEVITSTEDDLYAQLRLSLWPSPYERHYMLHIFVLCLNGCRLSVLESIVVALLPQLPPPFEEDPRDGQHSDCEKSQ